MGAHQSHDGDAAGGDASHTKPGASSSAATKPSIFAPQSGNAGGAAAAAAAGPGGASDDTLPSLAPSLARTRSLMERVSVLESEGYTPARISLALDALTADVPPYLQVDWCRKWMTRHPPLSDEERKAGVGIVMSPGFTRQESIDALAQSKGNVQGALQLLIDKSKADEAAAQRALGPDVKGVVAGAADDEDDEKGNRSSDAAASTPSSPSSAAAAAAAGGAGAGVEILGKGLTGEKRQDFFMEQYLRICKLVAALPADGAAPAAPAATPEAAAAAAEDAAYVVRVIEFLYLDSAKEAAALRAGVEKERVRLEELKGLVGDGGLWEWKGPSGFATYDKDVTAQLEKAFREHVKSAAPTEVRFKAGNGQAYTVSITGPTTYQQVNDVTGNVSPVKRTTIGGNPAAYFARLAGTASQDATVTVNGRRNRGRGNSRGGRRGKGGKAAADDDDSSSSGAAAAAAGGAAAAAAGAGDEEKKGPEAVKHAACQVCYSDFAADCVAVSATACGHQVICTDCFQQYVETKVNDGEVLPYIRCPEPSCKLPVLAADIQAAHLPAALLFRLSKTHMQKTIVRNPDWVACSNPKTKCPMGFLHRKDSGVKETKACPLCKLSQTVVKASVALDEDFIRMKKVRSKKRNGSLAVSISTLCSVIP